MPLQLLLIFMPNANTFLGVTHDVNILVGFFKVCYFKVAIFTIVFSVLIQLLLLTCKAFEMFEAVVVIEATAAVVMIAFDFNLPIQSLL